MRPSLAPLLDVLVARKNGMSSSVITWSTMINADHSKHDAREDGGRYHLRQEMGCMRRALGVRRHHLLTFLL